MRPAKIRRKHSSAQSKRRQNLLKMGIGKANHHLKKSIMFYLAGKLSLLTCHRCKQPIAHVQQFSIDHKESWQKSANPIQSFFSLENIAFSHTSCNTAAAIRYRKYKTPEEAKAAKAKQQKSPKYLAVKRRWQKKWRDKQRHLIQQ